MQEMEHIVIKRIQRFSPKLLEDLNKLLLQLSSSGFQMDKRHIKAVLKNKRTYVICLYDGQRVIGTATLVDFYQIRNHKGYIENVVIDEQYRGRGLGKKLIGYMIELAKELKLDKIELKSEPRRTVANILYREMGFTLREVNYYDLDLEA